ncbi:MAG TPA: CpsB/CapC family capsule biosynthesis tyrosine phosphatase [Solirubrobacteraceae bacterium]
MIDLHCHILPGVDDGALDLADSLAMARQAAADGIAAVCATPHIRHDHAVRIAELAGRVRALAAAGAAVELLGGGEVAEPVAASLSDAELRLVPLGGGGRWILLEPRVGPLSDALTATVDGLAARGFACVIAHPERHLVEDFHDRLRNLTGRGALVQVTAALLEGGPAADALLSLITDDLAHAIASDAHSSHGGRPVRLSGAFAALRAAGIPEARMRRMAEELPRAIVRGEPVPTA